MNSKLKLIVPVSVVAATAVFAAVSLTTNNHDGSAEPAVQSAPKNTEHVPQRGSVSPAAVSEQAMERPSIASTQETQTAGSVSALDDAQAESESEDEGSPASIAARNNAGATVEEDFVESGSGYLQPPVDNSVIHISNVGDRIVVTRSSDSRSSFTRNNDSNLPSNNSLADPGSPESSSTGIPDLPPPQAAAPVGAAPSPAVTDPTVNTTPDSYTPENDENVWVTANCPAQLPQGSSADDAQTMATSYGCEYLRYCRPLNDGSQDVYCWWGFWRGPGGAG